MFSARATLAALLCALGPAAAKADSCTLAGPRQLIEAQAPGVRSHSYALVGERESQEVVVLASGAKLQVSMQGCEYLVLAVRAETPGRALSSGDTRAAYLAAANALTDLAVIKPDILFDLPLAAKALRRQAARKAPPEHGVRVPVPMELEPRPWVSVDTWGSLPNGWRFVELRLVWGPG